MYSSIPCYPQYRIKVQLRALSGLLPVLTGYKDNVTLNLSECVSEVTNPYPTLETETVLSNPYTASYLTHASCLLRSDT